MFAFLGKLFVGFLAAVGALGLWGLVKKDGGERENALTQSIVENVHDLRDRFNRARYMDRDGK